MWLEVVDYTAKESYKSQNGFMIRTDSGIIGCLKLDNGTFVIELDNCGRQDFIKANIDTEEEVWAYINKLGLIDVNKYKKNQTIFDGLRVFSDYSKEVIPSLKDLCRVYGTQTVFDIETDLGNYESFRSQHMAQEGVILQPYSSLSYSPKDVELSLAFHKAMLDKEEDKDE